MAPVDPPAQKGKPLILVLDSIIAVILVLIYGAALIGLSYRRNFQPLKSRGSKLVTVSTLGNFLFSLALICIKILNNVYLLGNEPGSPTP